jgi:ABC-2 type transport system permease protein
MNTAAYTRAACAIITREVLRFGAQGGRLLSALVRPLLWLVVFAAGFRAALGLSITPPYQTYILYEVYITPGLAAMTLLFAGMQGALGLVYDRSMGAMRVMMSAPFPRGFLLLSRLIGTTLVSVVQAEVFLVIAYCYGIDFPPLGLLHALPALFVSALMIGAAGLVMTAFMRRVENFASVMNFVIFPTFFASSALYPLWKMQESSPAIALVCALNPFTHAVELVRFALYARFEPLSALVVGGTTALMLALALWSYDPARSFAGGRGDN